MGVDLFEIFVEQLFVVLVILEVLEACRRTVDYTDASQALAQRGTDGHGLAVFE